ncbi:MAG: hypothetical protein INR71_00585, partial [Terriglobus roseus]|nr:hypothetical protein [Terriglobus roseus]
RQYTYGRFANVCRPAKRPLGPPGTSFAPQGQAPSSRVCGPAASWGKARPATGGKTMSRARAHEGSSTSAA